MAVLVCHSRFREDQALVAGNPTQRYHRAMDMDRSARFLRYGYVDADPRAEPGSPQRLRWEYVCAMMDAEEFRRRASLAGADGKMSERDRAQFMLMLSTAMGVSRVLLAAVNAETLARRE